MSKNTLQGWCTPTLDGYADHTFVYCPEAKSYFNCWGGGDITKEDTVLVCSKEYEGAYCRANNYRVSIGIAKDTAGVGIYGVNGVCHQSANLFLYSAGTVLPLTKSRPRGIIASHAMYGFYGTNIPGPGGVTTWGIHFAAWYSAFYLQAKTRCLFSIDESEKLEINSDDSLFQKVNGLHSSVFERNQNILSAEDLIVNEFKIIAKEMAPDIDVNQFEGIHRDFLKEKDDILKSAKIYGDKPEEIKLPQGKTAEEVVEKLNDLICEFQKSLAESVGSSHYEQLTGNKQNEIFRLIDPRIAVENWSNY
jgi:hypothetical protein